ncbi:MAG: hypothetical protein MJ252_02455 [archaeon]|nr:hypothetical protein [archaeon]
MITLKYVFADNPEEEKKWNVNSQDATPFATLLFQHLDSVFKDPQRAGQFSLFSEKEDLPVLDMKSAKFYANKKVVLTMKNFSYFAKEYLSQLEQIWGGEDNLPDEKKQKKWFFNLSKYVDVIPFAEEFISYGGLKKIIDVIEKSSFTIRNTAMNAISNLCKYQSTIGFVKEYPEVFDSFYNMLCNLSNVNEEQKQNTLKLSENLLKIFNVLLYNMGEFGSESLLKVAENYASDHKTIPFEEIVGLIGSNYQENQVNALALVTFAIKNASKKRTLQSKLVVLLKDAKIDDVLLRNTENPNQYFQDSLNSYQNETNEVIQGSNYSLEFYKKKISKLENQLSDSEKQSFQSKQTETFYKEMVNDFLKFKRMADNLSSDAGYYDPYTPTERYYSYLERDKGAKYDLIKLSEGENKDDNIQNLVDQLQEKNSQLQENFNKLMKSFYAKNMETEEDELKGIEQLKKKNDEIAELKDKSNALKEEAKNYKERIIQQTKGKIDKNITTNLSNVKQEEYQFIGDPKLRSKSSVQAEGNKAPENTGSNNAVPPVPSEGGVPPPPPPCAPPPPPPPMVIVKKILPTKPKINLKVKTKKIDWVRFLNDPEKPNFWSKLFETNKISMDDITNAFEIKKKAPKIEEEKIITADELLNPTPKKLTFLDPTRAQKVGITIAKLPKISDVAKGLETMNESYISMVQIEGIIREFIKENEINSYKAQDSPGAVWEKSEDYLISLYKIPFCKEKCIIWKNCTILDEYNLLVANDLDKYERGVKEIKNNEILKKFFAYILTVGNILNGGTAKGQADGFNLDVLPKLSSIKDANGKNILTFIINKMKEKEGISFTNFTQSFKHVKGAAQTIFNEIGKNKNIIKRCVEESKKLHDSITLNDEFMALTKKKVDSGLLIIEKIEKQFNNVEKATKEIIKFYGYVEKDDVYKNIEKFFKLINNFISDVDKAIPKEEIKKMYNKTHKAGATVQDNNMQKLISELKHKQSIKGNMLAKTMTIKK